VSLKLPALWQAFPSDLFQQAVLRIRDVYPGSGSEILPVKAAFCFIIKLLLLRLLFDSRVILLEKKNSFVVNMLQNFLDYFVGHPNRREGVDF
jgi:hypothetical protein